MFSGGGVLGGRLWGMNRSEGFRREVKEELG